MSRWAAGITAGFLLILWPAVVVSARAWRCPGDCRLRGGEIVLEGVVALILAPAGALLFLLARRLKGAARAVLVILAVATLLAAMGLWSRSAGGVLHDANGIALAAESFVLGLVMAVYCAAVAGGSWMSAIGVRRLEGEQRR